jgi:plasmid stability protein
MATVTVRKVKESTKRALQHRAGRHGVSMEQEIRSILDDVAKAEGRETSRRESLYEAIRRLVEPYGGFDLELPERQPPREPPAFS